MLDKIVARRIQHEVAKEDIVPLSQFGGQIHSSTVDAGLAFTQDIYDAWARGLKVSALFFDITGFFNFVNHKGLVARLRHHGFDEATVSLIKSFLEDRTTSLSFNEFLSNPVKVPNGIPQGSPLSPILSIIYGADLQRLRSLILWRVASFAYIDDGAIITFSPSLNTNVTRLQNAFNDISHWLTANGLQVQENKIELMHFTKGPDPSSPALRIPGMSAIVAPKTLRWLGFYLDRHLNFTHHTRVMAACASATTSVTF